MTTKSTIRNRMHNFWNTNTYWTNKRTTSTKLPQRLQWLLKMSICKWRQKLLTCMIGLRFLCTEVIKQAESTKLTSPKLQHSSSLSKIDPGHYLVREFYPRYMVMWKALITSEHRTKLTAYLKYRYEAISKPNRSNSFRLWLRSLITRKQHQESSLRR